MKSLAKLMIFFSANFAVIFLAAILLRYLGYWIEMARFIPVEARPGVAAADAAWAAFPQALYLSILFTISYTARKAIPIPVAVFCTVILAAGFAAGVSQGITHAASVQPAFNPVPPVQGEPGLILTQQNTAIILLRESSEIRGPRVVSIPDLPLIYQETPLGPNNTILALPALPFGTEAPWFIRSLDIDFSLSAAQMQGRMNDSFYSFALYVLSLILLLVSMRFILELSHWPLANLVFGFLVFRGILTLEIFINSSEINTLIGAFLAGRLPPMLISPFIFTAISALVLFYTLLSRLAKPRKGKND